jgi:hypothetical protein
MLSFRLAYKQADMTSSIRSRHYMSHLVSDIWCLASKRCLLLALLSVVSFPTCADAAAPPSRQSRELIGKDAAISKAACFGSYPRLVQNTCNFPRTCLIRTKPSKSWNIPGTRISFDCDKIDVFPGNSSYGSFSQVNQLPRMANWMKRLGRRLLGVLLLRT